MRLLKTYRDLVGSFVLAFLLGIMAFPMSVQAAAGGSISLYYDDSVSEQAEVLLYRVGELNDQGEILLDVNYASYQVDVSDSSAAQLLKSYIRRDGLEADARMELDEEGKAVFQNLEDGVYLVLSDAVLAEGYIYQPFASLVSLPYINEKEELDRNLEIRGKCEKEPVPEKVTVTVRKIWADAEDLSSRPQSIVVQLLQNNVVAEEVELSKDGNNWFYAWENLDGDAVWTVVEKNVPQGYHVSIERNGEEYRMVNSKDKPQPPEKPTVLPKTGQLWWPVMPLVCAGLIFIIIGVLIRRHNADV